MNYSQFLFGNLLFLHDTNMECMEYDLMWGHILKEYEGFENSQFFELNQSEYQCMLEYLQEKFKNV